MTALIVIASIIGYLLAGVMVLVVAAKVESNLFDSDFFEFIIEEVPPIAGMCIALWPVVISILLFIGVFLVPWKLAEYLYKKDWTLPERKPKQSPKALGSQLESLVDVNKIMQMERDELKVRADNCYCDDAHLSEYCPKPLTLEEVKWRKELAGYIYRVSPSKYI